MRKSGFRRISALLCVCLFCSLFVGCSFERVSFAEFKGVPKLGGYWWLSNVDENLYNGGTVYEIPQTDTAGNAIVGIGTAAITEVNQIEEIIIGDHIEWLSDYAIAGMPNLKACI